MSIVAAVWDVDLFERTAYQKPLHRLMPLSNCHIWTKIVKIIHSEEDCSMRTWRVGVVNEGGGGKEIGR